MVHNLLNVLGWYDHANCGDESYKLTFCRAFSKLCFEFTDYLRTEQLAQPTILGGGNVLHPHFIKQLQKVNAKRWAFSVGCTNEVEAVKNNLGLFEHMYVRDVRSLSLLENWGYASKCTYTPDLAFLLTPNVSRGASLICKLFAKHHHTLKNRVIVIVLNAAFFNPESANYYTLALFENLVEQLESLMEHYKDTSFIFLPFCIRFPYDDRLPCSVLAKASKSWKKNVLVFEELSVQNNLDVIACSHAVISCRLHSSIFSTVAGVPFVDISHHDKNLGFLDTVNLTGYSIPYWDFDYKRCISLLDNPSPLHLRTGTEQRNILERVISNVHFI